MNVLYETYKCKICNKISSQLIKCKFCDAIYCKNCPIMHNDERFAYISCFKPRCKYCYAKMYVSANKDKKSLGMSKLDEFDHIQIDNAALE